MYLPGLLLLILLLPPLSLQDSHQSESKIAMGEKILPALEKATSYLENRYREFNLDSLVGFLMLKVQLKGVLEKWAHDSDLKFLTLSVEEILKRLSVIIPRTKVFLKIVNLKYLEEFQETLQPEFWKLPLSWSHTNPSMIYSKFDTAHPFLEESSDSCMTLLLGTKEKNEQSCKVTEFCKGIMTAPGKSGEELVKQLFYFLIAKMNLARSEHLSTGVKFSSGEKLISTETEVSNIVVTTRIHDTPPPLMDQFSDPHLVAEICQIPVRPTWSVLHLQKGCSGDMFLKSKYYMDIFCANMMELNLKREKNGFSFQNKGLFMTNIMLCGFSGYSDFYKIHWINTILNWQNSKEGCYWKIFVIGNQPLMRNNHLEGGCSSLNTAVAVVSLGGFLYYSADHSLTI